ncbi:MAG: hypothetical protein R2796_03730 [Chitinophagaceae bacterium]|nr:hypothetical protein [Chitinophagaceae bacterium]MCB0740530.1 hypothetical protein [Chitinophagaceae bacterium]HQU56720.1 hypothetical protein [Chitinophagaceae bacterium]HQV05129.1 hypothetical protein [Chitinophagaceae bacterium]
MQKKVQRLLATAFFSLLFFNLQAQPTDPPTAKDKPYKIMTTRQQVTIKSTKPIQKIMLWTINGNRVVEQKEVNKNNISFNVPIRQPNFFLMIGLTDGKIFTEKIAMR